jgi:hypothetical protein
MVNRVDIILISKKHNILKNFRLPVVALIVIACIISTITISTIILCINRTRRTFVRMNLTRAEREGKNLVARLDSLNLVLRRSQDMFDGHVAQDNRERTYWQMAHVHPDIWSMGIGGKQVERSPQIINKYVQRTIDDVNESIDVLKGKYYLRYSSLREIQEQIEDNLYLWSHIPSIHPVPGRRICSGYGYRVDPIDRKVRMHWGVDLSLIHI